MEAADAALRQRFALEAAERGLKRNDVATDSALPILRDAVVEWSRVGSTATLSWMNNPWDDLLQLQIGHTTLARLPIDDANEVQAAFDVLFAEAFTWPEVGALLDAEKERDCLTDDLLVRLQREADKATYRGICNICDPVLSEEYEQPQ